MKLVMDSRMESVMKLVMKFVMKLVMGCGVLRARP